MLRISTAAAATVLLCSTPCLAQQNQNAAGYNVQAEAGDSAGIGNLSGQQILALAKFAGACGELNAMADFQTGLQMPSGDDFVVRMWNVESARLGLTTAQLVERCNQAISGYQVMWSAANG